MSMSDPLQPTELSLMGRDWLAATLRSVAGGVPFAGGLLSEVITATIPHLREQRLADFVARLDRRLEATAHDTLRMHALSPGGADIVDEAVRQALRATLDERRERIASLTARALASDQADMERFQRLLSILDQLADSELIIVRAHVFSPDGKRTERDHADLVHGQSLTHGAPEEARNREALRSSFVHHLESLGLLHRQLRSYRIEGRETPLPEIDTFRGELRTGNWRITPLGTLLLKVVDFYPSDADDAS